MTEDAYWRMFHLIRGDVEAAIDSDNTYITINNLAAADREVWNKLNRSARFWTLNCYALQTTSERFTRFCGSSTRCCGRSRKWRTTGGGLTSLTFPISTGT